MRWNVYRNVDEVLYNRKMNLLAYLQQHPRAPYAGDNPLDDFTFYKIGEPAFRNGKEAYSNTLIYEPVDDELDEYRKLVSYVKLHGNFYRLEIIKPHLEDNEIITRSEEHTSELQSLMRNSYAVFRLKKKTHNDN